MKRLVPDREWDVVIVDATGAADQSHTLRSELVSRGLRVKLDIVPPPSVSVAPALIHDDAKRAAYCVVLMTAREKDATEETSYVAVPAPHYSGQVPLFAPPGTKVPPGSIETGRIRMREDIVALAMRIAERLRAAKG